LTYAEPFRLWLVARSEIDRPSLADRLGAALAAETFEPTVTANSFDTASSENIEEHVGSVYRYALRLTGRADQAEDLAQETMLRGWRGRQQLKDPRVARVWLLSIATNVWNDELRRAKLRTQSLTEEPPCPRRLVSSATGDRENVRLALAAMDELPPRQRQVLYLATCEGLDNGEVAAVLEISDAAVKANLSLARKEMRRRLKDIYQEVCGQRAGNET
jgi:RNA polymerase sigma-70 factor, ECF subfamily